MQNSPLVLLHQPLPRLLRAPATQILASVITIATLTSLMLIVLPVIHSATAALLYILVVLLSATAFGLGASLCAALLAAVVFTYFFIPPYGGFGITSAEDALRLGAFLAVALLTSGLASSARRQGRTAAQRAAELSALYQLSQKLEAEVELERMLPIVARATSEMLAVPGCELLLTDGQGQLVRHAAEGAMADTAHEDAILRADHRLLGVLRVSRQHPAQPLTTGERELLETIALQVSLVLERVRLSEVAGQARVLAESDRLKSTLLSMVSHDLRTPLAVIKGLVTSLLDTSIAWTDALRRELLTTINEETDRLNRIVGELLEMSRIEAGAISQARSWHDLDELIVAVVEDLRPRLQSHPLQLDVPNDLPWVRVSYQQIEQVLRNLLENAAHYTPPASPIEVWARAEGTAVRVEVRDRGPGVAAELRERIFEKFVRAAAPERHAEGSGLGLAICKGLIDAHGGQIWVAERAEGGAVFSFTLPIDSSAAPQPAAAGTEK